MSVRAKILAVMALAVLVPGTAGHAVTSTAGSGPPRFVNVALAHQGAEPSIAVDTSHTRGRGFVYVVAIGDPNGPLEWHSYDGGRTFSKPVPFDRNGPARGEDSDVAVNTNGNVLAEDLDVSHASVQISTDHGKTFDAGTQTAPEDDRPWITANGKDIYVAYHDFTLEVPVVCFSTDGGHTFDQPCAQAFGPGNPASISNCTENTIPARPLVVDPTDGSLNFLYSCSTQAENAQHPPFGPLHDYYLAQSTDGGQTWTTYTVFTADMTGGKTPSYANIFGTLAADSAGNYYALFAGTADDADTKANPYHVYLAVSKDHGHTWSTPIQVDHDRNGAGTHVLPHLAVTTPGNVDVVWYGTSRTGEPNGVCGTSESPCKYGFPPFRKRTAPPWHVFLAQSHNALSSTPSFTQAMVNTAATHYGRICTNGIVCGSSDRTLLDFISVAVDCHGDAHVAYGSNTKRQERHHKTLVRVASQVGGRTIAPPAAC